MDLETEEIVAGANGLYSKLMTRKYDALDRPEGFQIGTGGETPDPDADYDITYHYDATSGRLNRITSPTLPAYGVVYTPVANSDLIGKIEYKSDENTVLAGTERAYLSNRDLLWYVKNNTGTVEGGSTFSKYEYAVDALGRRTSVIMTGSAFDCSAASDGNHHWDYGYNSRSELTSANRRSGVEVDAGMDFPANGVFDYQYDPIGNRTDSYVDDANLPMSYTRNNLNQYEATTGAVAETFSYDADGNLTADSTYKYVWDAENRLIRIEPVSTAVIGGKKLEFTYDYMGRRVHKVYEVYNGNTWIERKRERFVYDDWNVVMVLDGGNTTKQKYTWGLDMSGLAGNGTTAGIHGAGGIGGLLASVETSGPHSGTYWFTYDGNGNVGQVLNATTPASITIAAHYEYDPYGNTISTLGAYAAANPYRFSTKWLDSELASWNINGAVGSTGLYYYGYRYYSPRLGRWMSRDPIEENGGINTYSFLANRSGNYIDFLGTYPIYDPFDDDPWAPRPKPRPDRPEIGGKQKCGCSEEYDPATQCCECDKVVDKVSIWVCHRPIETWYGNIIWPLKGHSYLCCEGPNHKCFSKGPHNKGPGPVDREAFPTGDCREEKVCPSRKKRKCENPTTNCPYDACVANCGDWINE